ncbi:PREDICTED: protein crumbs homolog 2-like [Priapulus caudatus]|uniref:Protein crumbs homolog 2-like n=1 Tax=Priapulus caudatus TaxID=37621 RepID=A0ABM1E408_PRICU|nr:PREDICTED: protein crumbs homolog 2-like [Priapulus caudatus]
MTRILFLLACIAVVAWCHCPHGQTKIHGCNLEDGKCRCSHGCDAEFRFANKDECKNMREDAIENPCNTERCKNDGFCVQSSQVKHGYKCDCSGTGFYGRHCEQSCNSATFHDDEENGSACIQF